jgi:hypothetical protein
MAGFTMWLVWPQTSDNAPESGPVLLEAMTPNDALIETGLVVGRLSAGSRPAGYRVYDDATGNLLREWDARH